MVSLCLRLARSRSLARGDLCAHLIHVEGLDLVDQVFEHGRWHSAGLTVDQHTVAERHDRRNRLDSKDRSQLLFGLGVDLGVNDVRVRLC